MSNHPDALDGVILSAMRQIEEARSMIKASFPDNPRVETAVDNELFNAALALTRTRSWTAPRQARVEHTPEETP